MTEDRRDFLKKLGVSTTALASTSIAGCLGEDADQDREVEEGLDEERKVRDEIDWVVNTERYYPERFQCVRYMAEQYRDALGIDVHEIPEEITVLVDREENAELDLVTYNWTSGDGDPDSILVDRFHSDGQRNWFDFSDDEYDEVAMQQRREIDFDDRQELVHESQRLLGELRFENQHLYNEEILGVNTDQVELDSVVFNPLEGGFGTVWNWAFMEPASEDGRRVATNNWDPTDQLNPFHHNVRGPSRNNTPTMFMHDFLTRIDPETFEPEPWAAESIEYTDDTTCVVTLRDDMLFHDGESVTVDDVLWTFETIIETETPAYTVFVDPIESIEQTGDWEITFTLEEPYAPFEYSVLGEIPILPEHYWSEVLADAGYEDEPWEAVIDDDRPIVGSGPFEYGTWDQGERFEMPAFEDHPFAAPNIDMRVQRPLATRDAELEALRQGDYGILDYWFGDPVRLQETAEDEDHLEYVTGRDDGRQLQLINVQRPPFDDVAFRQALNAVTMANQQVMINEIYNGFGHEAVSPINESLDFWHNPDTPTFGPGEEAAVEILEDAGYVWNEAGELHHPEDRMDTVRALRNEQDL